MGYVCNQVGTCDAEPQHCADIRAKAEVFCVGAPKGFISKAFVVNGNGFQLGEVRQLMTEEIIALRSLDDLVNDSGEGKWRSLFLHRAEPLFHTLLEPLTKLTPGPNHEVVDMDKNNADDLSMVKIMSNCSVKKVVVVYALD